MTTEQFPARGEYVPGSPGHIRRELDEARELLAAIRDDEVNAQDEADKFLRDHKFSALHAALEEIERLKGQLSAAIELQLSAWNLGVATGWRDAKISTGFVENEADCTETLRRQLADLYAEIHATGGTGYLRLQRAEAERDAIKRHADVMAGIIEADWGHDARVAAYRAEFKVES